jgi:hypothetical protein
MIASHDGEQSSRIWERSLLDVLHPRAINADRHFVLGLACNRARMASDTLPVVDDEAEVHKVGWKDFRLKQVSLRTLRVA